MTKEAPFDPYAGMTPEEVQHEKTLEAKQQAENPELWKKNNEWLDQLLSVLEDFSQEDVDKTVEKVEKFMLGELTWAELKGMPPQILFKMSEFGYLQFKRGNLKDAEIIFKGLSILDHRKAYFHTLLGAIHQRQDRWFDAIAEYTLALEIDPNDVTSYVNRGEILYRVGYYDEPLQDFEKAIALDPQGKNSWANRARALKNVILQELQENKGHL